MKKTCIALIVLVALLSMLAACGKQADDPAGADSTSTDAITSVPVSYATHALAGSAAHIQYLVNMIPACFVKFDLDGPHLPTCIKMYRYRHIPLFKLHSLYPLSCEIPHGMYCVVILGIDTAQYRIGHGDSAAHAHIAISLPQPVHSHVNLFPRTPTPIIIK